MTRILALLVLLAVAACAPAPDVAERRAPPDLVLPAMKTFPAPRTQRPTRSNQAIARDFMDLAFRLESGRPLPVLTRFEGPVTVRVAGRVPPTLVGDLDRLIARLRSEAGIPIRRVAADEAASITVAVISRRDLQRAVPQAACFVAPNVSSWEEFLRDRRSSRLDWTELRVRTRMAVFLPGDVAPQEIRDCLHEEIAQALGPLNDLYRLTDSVFNDDNFHTVLTGFDMLILRAYYARELRSGMTPLEVSARLPRILDRINPRGRGVGTVIRAETSRDWVDAIETALGPRTSQGRRMRAARDAVAIARSAGWADNRLAFSLYALGRLSLASAPDLALASFLQAGSIYRTDPDTRLQEAHVAMQLAAFALTAGQPDAVVRLVDGSIGAVEDGQNAALLASLLLVKSEALDLLGDADGAEALRRESLGWARYGFGDAGEVRRRVEEIRSLTPRTDRGNAS